MVLIIKSNIHTLRKNYATRIKKLKKAGIKSQKQAARFMSLTAKKLAPKRTGGIVSGIRVVNRKKHSKVISKVFKTFPYNLWVNESSPYKKIRLMPRFRPRGMKKRIQFYYREVAKTGTPKFFTIAAMRTRPKFKKITFDNVHKALQITATTGGSLK